MWICLWSFWSSWGKRTELLILILFTCIVAFLKSWLRSVACISQFPISFAQFYMKMEIQVTFDTGFQVCCEFLISLFLSIAFLQQHLIYWTTCWHLILASVAQLNRPCRVTSLKMWNSAKWHLQSKYWWLYNDFKLPPRLRKWETKKKNHYEWLCQSWWSVNCE